MDNDAVEQLSKLNVQGVNSPLSYLPTVFSLLDLLYSQRYPK